MKDSREREWKTRIGEVEEERKKTKRKTHRKTDRQIGRQENWKTGREKESVTKGI